MDFKTRSPLRNQLAECIMGKSDNYPNPAMTDLTWSISLA
jgi:hypothetical protein